MALHNFGVVLFVAFLHDGGLMTAEILLPLHCPEIGYPEIRERHYMAVGLVIYAISFFGVVT